MNEHSYTHGRLKRQIGKVLPDVLWWKIADPYAGGVPDLFLEGAVRDVWIEIKYIPALPKRPTTLIDLTNPKQYLSKNQQEWLGRRHSTRGDTLVIVGHPDGCMLFWGDSWKQARPASYYRENSVKEKTAAEAIAQFINQSWASCDDCQQCKRR